MPNACHKHIAITPFSQDLVLNGVKAVVDFKPSSLKRLSWPQEKGCRKAQGGDYPISPVRESLRIVWENDRLIFPISEVPQALAERTKTSVIRYQGMFIAQLDGEVAYQPSDQNIEFYYILVENVDHKLNAIRFSPDQTAVIDSYVKHSMPIPAKFGLDYDVYHRPTNAIEAFLPDSVEPPVFNLMKVDRITLFAAGRIPQKQLASNEHYSLSKSFSKKLITIEEPTAESFEAFGQIITDPNYVEEVSTQPWPGVTTQDGHVGPLEQDFQMTWIKNDGGYQELRFSGFTGSFSGEEGKPGVAYYPELGVYKANLLMTRPDSTFFLKPASTEASWIMSFAAAKNGKGEPDDCTQKTFVFRGGKAIRLHAFTYHTVPIPLQDQESVIFSEVIAATNANIVIDVLAETGHPIQFSHGV